MLGILVQAAEILAAVNNMNQAMEIYNGAVEDVKSAAAELADQAKGDTIDAFVASQDNAYTWYKQIIQVVREMIGVIRKAIELYNQMEDTVKSVVHG